MFSSISENPHKPMGKLANETTRKMISTQYTLGLPEWQPPMVSQTKTHFAAVIINIWLYECIANKSPEISELLQVRW